MTIDDLLKANPEWLQTIEEVDKLLNGFLQNKSYGIVIELNNVEDKYNYLSIGHSYRFLFMELRQKIKLDIRCYYIRVKLFIKELLHN